MEETKQWYIGFSHGILEAFRSVSVPTATSKYGAVIGPMTRRAAEWAEKNPYFRNCEDAEFYSKRRR